MTTFCECGDHAFRPFVRGSVLLVDVEDHDVLAARLSYTASGLKIYATIYSYPEKDIRLHRHIAGAVGKEWVDHANRNTCDNRRKNLRRCTPAENAANRAPKKGTKSGFKGVFPAKGRFEAFISRGGKRTYLGHFPTAELAHAAYKAAAIEFYGEFARWENV